MTRGRDSRRLAAFFLALATLPLGACIFSPDRKIDPPKHSTYPALTSEDSLVETLQIAYQKRDYDKFQTLLAAEADSKYQFMYYKPGGNVDQWDLTEELRIHQRMFQPESPPPGTNPVPPELWLVSVQIKLTKQREWTERTDLYRDPGNPNSGGLDPAKWKVTDGLYKAEITFQLPGDNGYRVEGDQDFVVIEDRAMAPGPGKFQIFRWQDLQQPPPPPAKPGAGGSV